MGVIDLSLTPMSICYLWLLFFVYSYLLNVGKAVFSFSFYVLLFGLASGSSGCFQYFYAQVVSMVSLTHDGQ